MRPFFSRQTKIDFFISIKLKTNTFCLINTCLLVAVLICYGCHYKLPLTGRFLKEIKMSVGLILSEDSVGKSFLGSGVLLGIFDVPWLLVNYVYLCLHLHKAFSLGSRMSPNPSFLKANHHSHWIRAYPSDLILT